MLGLEGDLERIVELVLSHSGKSDVLWVWEIFSWGTIDVTEKLCDFSDTIGTVVEEENLIAI